MTNIVTVVTLLIVSFSEKSAKKKEAGKSASFSGSLKSNESITVMVRLIGSINGHVDIVRLLLGQGGQVNTDLLKMQSRHLLIKHLGLSSSLTEEIKSLQKFFRGRLCEAKSRYPPAIGLLQQKACEKSGLIT